MASRWYSIVVHATDPARLARWWGEVLGYRIADEAPGQVSIDGGGGPRLTFVPVTEAKKGTNRLHFALDPEEHAAEVERLVNMGARRVDTGQGEDPRAVVLADPEGNEFRVLHAGAAAPVR